jgi:murein DD-endopeptidase MepM/ murein hydrolase activator NlpD
VPGWQQLALTEAAQAVQRSAYPDAYAKHEPAATALVNALAGADIGGCFATGEWTQPVNAPVGSGFRTSDRPGHDGVDLSAARGTTIRAASAGKVIRVRCNAIDVRNGSEWGCDRDGSPEWTRGCGWYVDIAHAGGIVTRYCHMGRPPAVVVGAAVVAGQPLGVVGSTGHSSGPHLHFEVHTNADESAAGAINPIPFMTSHGAPLGESAR